MYEEHPNFNSPPPETTLWRYMDFTGLVSLLDTSALFFSRTDKLDDPFEGTYGDINYALHPILYKDDPKLIDQLPHIYKNFRRYVAVNCWHSSEYESAAMWRHYARDHGGVAIKTDFASLASSFTDAMSVYIGSVEYIDYRSTFIPEGNLFSAFLRKRKSFEYEQEVRALISEMPPDDGSGIGPHSPDVWDVGKPCQVDLGQLVHKIVVSPLSPEWVSQLVQSVASKYDLRAPVRRSILADDPARGYRPERISRSI